MNRGTRSTSQSSEIPTTSVTTGVSMAQENADYEAVPTLSGAIERAPHQLCAAYRRIDSLGAIEADLVVRMGNARNCIAQSRDLMSVSAELIARSRHTLARKSP